MTKRVAFAALLLLPSVIGCASTESSSENTDTESDAVKVCAKGTTVKGVDVSYYQGTIDWAKVKASGIAFAIARVGDGPSYVDSQFANNWAGMKAHGIIRGTYQFFRPEHDPIAQADLMLKTIKAHGGLQAGDLPPMLDVEVQDGVSDATIRTRIQQWMDHVEAAIGRKPMIYTAPGFWDGIGANTSFNKYPLVVANWETSCPSMPNSWSGWKFWQNADNGTVPGISGHVDTDVFNGSLADLKAFAGGSSSGGGTTTPTPTVASLGGTVAAAPGVGRNADGRLEVFAVGPKGNLETKFQTAPNGGWSDWYSLGGNLEGRPAVANNQDGRIEIFARSAGGTMEHAWQDAPNGKVGSWASLGGSWAGDPAVARNSDGRLEVFAIGSDGAVHHVWQTKANGGWSSWASLGKAGGGLSDVTAVAGKDGKIRVFARGKDQATYMIAEGASAWGSWKSIGGKATSAPTVVLSGSGELGAFVRGTDGALWHAWENSPGGTWSAWISLAGGVNAPAAATDADGRMEVFVRGNDNELYRTRQKTPGGAWEGWTKMGGTMAGAAEAIRNKDGRLEVFFRGTDSAIHHAWEKAPEQW